ncbi:MAG: PaaI family thioesterase [Myxococcales bacterium]|nr:PaaI family thioesterase [Myxococcales bacterium]MCB9578605.1 PaaI family thioesterase [Polyangiaceae bacterium]
MTENFADAINESAGGFNRAMGLRVVRANRDEVVGEWVVGPEHHQPYGIVHGGVFSGLIETLCSVGAALDAMPRGQSVVGIENHTSFLRAVREGKLTCTALPLQRGRRAQLWEGAVRDEQGRLVASGRVRLMCLEGGAALAGETVGVKPT